MREEIIQLLEKEECSYKILKRKIKFEKEENLKELLQDMELAGEIFLTEGGIYKIFPKNFKIGKVQFTKSKNAFLLYEDGSTQFIKSNQLNGALNYDTVIVNLDTIAVEKILARDFSKVVCEVQIRNGIKYLKPYNVAGDFNLRIDSKHMKNLKEKDRIVVDVSLEKMDEFFEGTFLDIIGNADDPDIELKSIAISNGFETEFSEGSLAQLKDIPQLVSKQDIKNRLDLRKKQIFTIDGKDTKDMDDAVSIEKLSNGNYQLGVHIADVSYYIKEGTPLFEEAKERGTSLYMVNSVIPMLPKEISNGICSLNPHVDRLTISCIMEIDQNGEIRDYQIRESVIQSKMKMSYEEVNKVLTETMIPVAYKPFEKDLHWMLELSQILTRQKEERGYLRFANTEIHFRQNKEGKVEEIIKEKDGIAEEMIENFMVLANACVATHLGWIDFIPSIYRNHGCPDFDKVNTTIDFISSLGYRLQTIKNINSAVALQKILHQLSNKEEFPILSTLLLKSMQRAVYHTKNIGHFALELPFYTHFTSPIRRFPDLAVHFILKKHTSLDLEFVDFHKMEQELQEICYHSSQKEKQADMAEEDAQKFKIMEYMKEHMQEVFNGYVTDINEKEIRVQTLEGIPGIVLCSTLPFSYHYNREKKCITKEKEQPILKVGHHLQLRAVDIDLENRCTLFYIDKNLTLEEKEKNKQKRKIIKQ